MKRISKAVFCVIFTVILVLSSAPFAFAVDNVYTMDFQKPVVDDRHGYLELLYQHRTTGNIFVEVVTFDLSFLSSTNNTDYYGNTMQVALDCSVSNDTLVMDFNCPDSYSSWYLLLGVFRNNRASFYQHIITNGNFRNIHNTYPSSWDLLSFHAYGNFSDITVDSGNDIDFVVTYGSDSVDFNCYQDIIVELRKLVNNNVLTEEKLDEIILNTNKIFEQNVVNGSYLNSIDLAIDYIKSFLDDQVTEINAELDRLLAQTTVNTEKLTELSNKVSVMIDVCTSIRDYTEQIYNYVWGIHEAVWDIDQVLWYIYDIINSQGESNLTSPDTSNMDGYLNAENSLLNNSNVDVSNVVQVDINQNALTVIWGLVQQVFDSNGKIFGAVLTVISLGIVAMVLGRKV